MGSRVKQQGKLQVATTPDVTVSNLKRAPTVCQLLPIGYLSARTALIRAGPRHSPLVETNTTTQNMHFLGGLFSKSTLSFKFQRQEPKCIGISHTGYSDSISPRRSRCPRQSSHTRQAEYRALGLWPNSSTTQPLHEATVEGTAVTGSSAGRPLGRGEA